MAIKIIDEPDIELTRAEYDQLFAQFVLEIQKRWMTSSPLSFEDWVHNRKQQEPITSIVKIEQPPMIGTGPFGGKVQR